MDPFRLHGHHTDMNTRCGRIYLLSAKADLSRSSLLHLHNAPIARYSPLSPQESISKRQESATVDHQPLGAGPLYVWPLTKSSCFFTPASREKIGQVTRRHEYRSGVRRPRSRRRTDAAPDEPQI